MPDLYGHLTPQGTINGNLQTIVLANNYNDLINKPSINSVELQGNKTAADLGLLTAGDIPVDSVNGQQGVVILDGDDIEYEPGTSVNSKITDLEAEIGSGPVVSVNGQQGVVELDGTDINYSLTKTLNQKIDEVAASIPVVSYPVTSVNTKTGDVVLDGDDIEYSEGVTVNDQIGTNTAGIGTNAAAIGNLSDLTTTDKSSIVGAVNEVDGKLSGSETIYSGGSTFVNNIGTAFSISPYDLRDYKFLRVTGYSSSIGSSQRFVLLLPNNYTALAANYYSCAVGGVLAVARIESTNGTFTLLNFTINGSVPTNGAMIGEIIGIKA